MARKPSAEDRAASDQRWSRLNAQVHENAGKRNWGLVRNAYHGMAKQLAEEDRHREAVKFYLVVLLFDASGPNNLNGGVEHILDAATIKELKAYDFNGECSEMLPGITGPLLKQASRAGMSVADIEELYRTEAARFHAPIMLLSVDETWAKIGAALTACPS